MAKLQVQSILNWRRRVGWRKGKTDPINSRPVKIFPCEEEGEGKTFPINSPPVKIFPCEEEEEGKTDPINSPPVKIFPCEEEEEGKTDPINSRPVKIFPCEEEGKGKTDPISSPPVKIFPCEGEGDGDPINSPPVRIFPCEEKVEDEVEIDEGECCQNWGPLISYQIEHEKKVAELEDKLKEAMEDAQFWFLKAGELDSNVQNLLLEQEMVNPPQNLEEEFGDNDVASSKCSCHGQSANDKWTCMLCGENEMRVVMLRCSHLSCFHCILDADTCPLCDVPCSPT